MILSGALKPGDRLPSEQELGKKSGASRTVVREALQALRTRGLIVSRRGSGSFAAEPKHGTLGETLSRFVALQKESVGFLELLDLRILIECHCAALVAAGSGSVRDIKKYLDEMERCGEDLPAFADADMAFHLAVLRASGHALFREVGEAVLPVRGRRLARTMHIEPDLAATTYREHVKIFEALENRDPAVASEAMRNHLEGSRHRLRNALGLPEATG